MAFAIGESHQVENLFDAGSGGGKDGMLGVLVRGLVAWNEDRRIRLPAPRDDVAAAFAGNLKAPTRFCDNWT